MKVQLRTTKEIKVTFSLLESLYVKMYSYYTGMENCINLVYCIFIIKNITHIYASEHKITQIYALEFYRVICVRTENYTGLSERMLHRNMRKNKLLYINMCTYVNTVIIDTSKLATKIAI